MSSTNFRFYNLPWRNCVAMVAQEFHERRRVLTYSLVHCDFILYVHGLMMPPELIEYIIELTLGLEEWCEIEYLYAYTHSYEYKKVLDDLWSDMVLHNLDSCNNYPQYIRSKYLKFLSAIEMHAFGKELCLYREPRLSFAQCVMRRLYSIKTKQKYWFNRHCELLMTQQHKRIKCIIEWRQDKEIVNWLLDLVGFICSSIPANHDMHWILNKKATISKKIGK